MRLCEGKSSAHEWISQKTYKPPKRKKPVKKSAGHFGIQDTKAMVRQSSFFSLQCVQRSWTTLAGVSPVTVIASEPCS